MKYMILMMIIGIILIKGILSKSKVLKIIAGIIFLLFVTKTIQIVRVDGLSMSPTFADGDILFTVRAISPQVDDVVTIWSPELNMYIVKRITGVAGDTVEYVFPGTPNDETDLYVGSQVVEEGHYFVQGDNWLDSLDSRYEDIGQISRSNIKNKVILNLSAFTLRDFLILFGAFIGDVIIVIVALYLISTGESEPNAES